MSKAKRKASGQANKPLKRSKREESIDSDGFVDLEAEPQFEDGPAKEAPLEQDLDESESEIEDEDEEEENEAGDDNVKADGDENDIKEPAQEGTKKKKKAPILTAEEIRALELAELIASPISTYLSEAVTQVLSPHTPPSIQSPKIKTLLSQVRDSIISCSSKLGNQTLRELSKVVFVPSLEIGSVEAEQKWMDIKYEWKAPKEVEVIGQSAWDAGWKEQGVHTVELAVIMPKSLLQSKDFMYPRYLTKSTHYLVCLSNALRPLLAKTFNCKPEMSYIQLPGAQGWALTIDSLAKGVSIHLKVLYPDSIFPPQKLSPTSNIRRPHDKENFHENETTVYPPTPLHSTCHHLSSFSLTELHLKFFRNLSNSHPSFPHIVRLLTIWGSSRKYHNLGLTSSFWAWCVAYVLHHNGFQETGGLSVGSNAWSGWRIVIEWLSKANWKEGIWFNNRESANESYTRDSFKLAFKEKALFVDPTGMINIASGLDFSTLTMLKNDCHTTMSLLLSRIPDERKFESCFLRPVRECERFDVFAKIKVRSNVLDAQERDTDDTSALKKLERLISTTLQTALNTRVVAFQLITPPPLRVSITQSSSSKFPKEQTVILGMYLDPAQALRLVDHGPAASDEAGCEEFRQFWGSKCELRRFKDGGIRNVIVWEAEDEQSKQLGLGSQRSKVVAFILKYILPLRVGIEANDINVNVAKFDHVLTEPYTIRKRIFIEDSLVSGKGFGAIRNAFELVSKEISGLDLPLSVSSIKASGPGLRYSDIFLPSARRLNGIETVPGGARYIETHDFLISLESSGRWPDDLLAIQKIKASFLLDIASKLQSSNIIASAQVVKDIGSNAWDDHFSLEILTVTGFGFRGRIYYERSMLLLEQRAVALGIPEDPLSESESSMQLFERQFVMTPKHHAAINNVQHKFMAYSGTVRLVKRWFSSHWLLPFFPEEMIELISAFAFIDPSSSFEAPSNGATGFGRVMEILTGWKYRDSPLFVPLYKFQEALESGRRPVIGEHGISEGRKAFEVVRKRYPALDKFAWVIVTEEDEDGIVWGRDTTGVLAGRVQSLAKATLKTLEKGVVEGDLDVDQLFTHPRNDYDFLIHVDPKMNPRYYQAFIPDMQALTHAPNNSEYSVRLAWDPVSELVKQLRDVYGSWILFLYEPGGSTIGCIFKPSVLKPSKWDLQLGFPSAPAPLSSGKKALVELNKTALWKNMERLGKDLVVKIE